MNKFFYFNILLILLVLPVFASINVIVSDQGTDVKVKSTNRLLTQGNLTVLIYTASSGGSLIYNETFVDGIVNGSWNFVLGETTNLPLDYGLRYYKDYEINDINLNFTNNTGGNIDRLPWDSPLGSVNWSYVSNEPNSIWLNDSSQIYVADAYPSFVNVSDVLFVNGSSETVGVGTIDISEKLVVSGNISALWFKGIFNWLIGSSPSSLYLSFNGTELNFNETKLNSTIDDRSTNSHVAGDGIYLYNDSTTMYFNETKLNSTIDDRSSTAAGIWLNSSSQIFINSSYPRLVNISDALFVNGSNPSVYMRSSSANYNYSSALGYNNVISGDFSFIGGGSNNLITEEYSVIPGGNIVNVSANYSFAFGHNITVGDDYRAVFFSTGNLGRLGINIEKPTQALDVLGNANFSGGVYASYFSSNSPLRLQTAGTTRIYVDDSKGYVGIGTTNPSAVLHLNGTNSTFKMNTASDSDPNSLFFVRSRSAGATTQNNDVLADIQFFGTNLLASYLGAKIKVVQDGVAVATNIPSRFEFLTNNGSSTNTRIVIKNDGKMGIGTTNPSEKLVVLGNVSALWFKGIFDWTIGSSSSLYLSFNGTELNFNETKLNASIDERRIWSNDSSQVFIKDNYPRIVNISDALFINGTNPSVYMASSSAKNQYSSAFGFNNSVEGDYSFIGGGGGGGYKPPVVVQTDELVETELVSVPEVFFDLNPEALFDVKVELKSAELTEKEALIIYVDLVNEGSFKEKLDVGITYTILDLRGNVLFYLTETRAVDGRLSYKKIFAETKLKKGEYIIQIDILYGANQKASAKHRFRVTEKGKVVLQGSPVKENYLIIILFSLLSIFIIVCIIIFTKKFIYSNLYNQFGKKNIKNIIRNKNVGKKVKLIVNAKSFIKTKEGHILKLEDATGEIYAFCNKKLKGDLFIKGVVEVDDKKNKFIKIKKYKLLKNKY